MSISILSLGPATYKVSLKHLFPEKQERAKKKSAETEKIEIEKNTESDAK